MREREDTPIEQVLGPVEFIVELRDAIVRQHEETIALSRDKNQKTEWLLARERRRRLNRVWDNFWEATDNGMQVKCFKIGDDSFGVRIVSQEPDEEPRLF